MDGLLHPFRLLGLVSWLLLILALFWPQRRALAWLQSNISPRFLGRLTRYSRRGLRIHFAFLFGLGGLVLLAAAGPYSEVDAERTTELQTIVLALDGSLSMGAVDALNSSPSNQDPEAEDTRFTVAKLFAAELVLELPEAAYAVLTFSGDAVIHSPPTRDLGALGTQLSTLTYHAYSQSMGSRFSSALEAVVHLMVDQPGSYQVVLLSDGELSTPDAYSDVLGVLAERGVPVHTVGVGSTEWQSMTVWNLEDVLAGVEDKRVAAEYRTRRETAELERMAETTGGVALVTENGQWVDDLLPALAAAEPEPTRIDGRGINDLSWLPLALFLVGFLFETLWIARRPQARLQPVPERAPKPAGPTARLLVLGVVLLPLFGCRSPLLDAHLFNQRGLAAQAEGDEVSATTWFEKSAAIGVRSQVPLSNLASMRLDSGDPAGAHELYERSLLLDPDLTEAHYGDGRALYAWGEQEIDWVHCRFDRARALWEQAAVRFETAAELGRCCSSIDGWALENAVFVRAQLKALDQMEADCQPPPSDDESPQDQSEDSSDGDGDGDGDGEGPGSGAPEGEGENGDSNRPPNPPPSGSPPPPGSGETSGGNGESPPAPPPLTQDELDQLRAELQRALAEAAGATGYRHSAENQITPEAAEAASGQPIHW